MYKRQAPIGYRKHPEIKNKLIIDEETRWIVEKIFDLAIHGRGAADVYKRQACFRVKAKGYGLALRRKGRFVMEDVYKRQDIGSNILTGSP